MFKHIMVAGGGVLGSQIAFQTAYKGFSVVVYDINEAALAKAKQHIERIQERYKKDLGATQQQLDQAFERIRFTADLVVAVENADLIIEAIPEVLSIKIDFYTQLAKIAPEKTIFASNSSTLLPSQLAAATGRPKQFLALHFANEIWKNNIAEVMKHADTDEQVFQSVIDFAKQIGMVALPIQKEQAGYILNSLLVPFLNAAQALWLKGVAEPYTIDKTWMIATGAPMGPFGILDVVGITTAYNIVKSQPGEGAQKLASLLKDKFIDTGKLGQESGEGFYSYPNPVYTQAEFLKN